MLKSKKAKIIAAIMVAVMLAVSVCAIARTERMNYNGIPVATAGLRVEGNTVTAVTTPYAMDLVSEVNVTVVAQKVTGDFFYGFDEASDQSGWPFGASVVSTQVTNCCWAESTHSAVPLATDLFAVSARLTYDGDSITAETHIVENN